VTDEERKADEEDAARQAMVALDAFEEATWDAIAAYRETGDLVPVMLEDKLEFMTVDEALRSRRDWAKRRDQIGRRKCRNLLSQFREEKRTIPPDLWDRLRADRRAQYEDELRWIEMARAEAEKDLPPRPAVERTNNNSKERGQP